MATAFANAVRLHLSSELPTEVVAMLEAMTTSDDAAEALFQKNPEAYTDQFFEHERWKDLLYCNGGYYEDWNSRKFERVDDGYTLTGASNYKRNGGPGCLLRLLNWLKPWILNSHENLGINVTDYCTEVIYCMYMEDGDISTMGVPYKYNYGTLYDTDPATDYSPEFSFDFEPAVK